MKAWWLGVGVQGLGVRVSGSGCRAWVSGLITGWVHCSGFRDLGSGFRVSDSGFRVSGSGSRVLGSGCRVPGFESTDSPGETTRAALSSELGTHKLVKARFWLSVIASGKFKASGLAVRALI